jgi:hypothetical protein
MGGRRVSLSLLLQVTAVALATGCGADHRTEVRRCADDRDWVVDDSLCEPPGRRSIGARGVTSYRWYYGGFGHYPGQYAYGGSRTPTPGVSAAKPAAPGTGLFGGRSARGGFGATGSSRAAGA